MTQPTPLHIERVGIRTYVGRNARGAEVRVGSPDGDGAFAPGELLQLALAACGLLSADHTISSRLGGDFAAIVDIDASKSEQRDRYDAIVATIRANMSALDEQKVAMLADRSAKVIEKLCTIGHTLGHGARHGVTIIADDDMPAQITP